MILTSFKTKRFVIKKFSSNLVKKNYLDWFNDEDIRKFINFKPKSLIELRKNIKQNLKDKSTVFLAIFFKKKHIGNIKIHNINKKKNEAWIGVLIGEKKFRGIGAFVEVLERIKDLLVKEKIYFLKLNVNKKNISAIKSYVKAGFLNEKVYKNYITMNCNIFTKKLILGLAQLQSKYGVTNLKKKILSKKNSYLILNQFEKSQINELDSAFSYTVDLKLLKKIKKKTLFNTKFLTSDIKFLDKCEKYLKKVSKIKNIQLNTLFIHDGNNLISKEGFELFNRILHLKKKKIIKKIGVSFHNFKNIKKILNNFKIDVVQIPFSAVDQRALRIFKIIKNKNIEIQARSIFLQGSLLSKIKTNSKLSLIYDKMLLKKKVDRVNSLLSFVLNEKNIDKILIGVRQASELRMILNFKKLKFYKNVYNNLKTKDESIINPLNWKELNYHEKKKL